MQLQDSQRKRWNSKPDKDNWSPNKEGIRWHQKFTLWFSHDNVRSRHRWLSHKRTSYQLHPCLLAEPVSQIRFSQAVHHSLAQSYQRQRSDIFLHNGRLQKMGIVHTKSQDLEDKVLQRIGNKHWQIGTIILPATATQSYSIPIQRPWRRRGAWTCLLQEKRIKTQGMVEQVRPRRSYGIWSTSHRLQRVCRQRIHPFFQWRQSQVNRLDHRRFQTRSAQDYLCLF